MPRKSFISFLLLSGLLVLSGCENDAAKAPQPEALKVVLAEVSQTTIKDQTTFNATLAAKETVEVRAKISGYLTDRLFDEGSQVKEGDILYKLDDRDLKANYDTAKARTASAEATWKNDELTKSRYIPLAAKGAISVQDRDAAIAKAAESLAAFNAAKAQEERAAVNLGYATITAPISGYINRSNVDVGGYVQAGSVLLTTMYRTDPIRAEFSITDREFAQFKKVMMERGGDPRSVVFHLSLNDEQLAYKYPGVMEMADPVLDSKTNTMGVRVEFPNPEHILRPGLFANITGELGPREALIVPEVAVIDRSGGKAVYTVDEKNTLVAVPVEIGKLYGENRVILKGLSAGQKVVVEGLVVAQPGMRVEVVTKEAAPSGSAPK